MRHLSIATVVSLVLAAGAPAWSDPTPKPTATFGDIPAPHVGGWSGGEETPVVDRPAIPRSGGFDSLYPAFFEELRDFIETESCGAQSAVLATIDRFRIDDKDADPILVSVVERCLSIPELRRFGVTTDDVMAVRARAMVRELLPAPQPRMGPPEWAVTGFDNYLWYADDGRLELAPIDHDDDPATPSKQGASVEASDGPFTIAATVWIDSYRWLFSNGDVEVASRPGTEDDPSAIWTPRTKDPENTVTVQTLWRGTFSWSSPADNGAGDMGELNVSAEPRPWPVKEIRAVLTVPPRD